MTAPSTSNAVAGVSTHWRTAIAGASSVATAARQASLTELVKSVARGEWHGTVLKAELGGAEAEAACLIDALRSAGELREVPPRTQRSLSIGMEVN